MVCVNETGCFLPFDITGRRLFEEVPFYKAIIIKIILHDMVPSNANANVSPIFDSEFLQRCHGMDVAQIWNK